MNSDLSIDKIFADLLNQTQQFSSNLPPVHLWHPDLCGDMDLRIDREGHWIHESVQINRSSMVKLFSSLLKLEEGSYYLVTPIEKWRIQVDIAPFYIVEATKTMREGIQLISLFTSTEETILLGTDNPLVIEKSIKNEPLVPLVLVRDNLRGFLSRSIYYQLIDWGYPRACSDGRAELLIDSLGCQFSLGNL